MVQPLQITQGICAKSLLPFASTAWRSSELFPILCLQQSLGNKSQDYCLVRKEPSDLLALGWLSCQPCPAGFQLPFCSPPHDFSSPILAVPLSASPMPVVQFICFLSKRLGGGDWSLCKTWS